MNWRRRWSRNIHSMIILITLITSTVSIITRDQFILWSILQATPCGFSLWSQRGYGASPQGSPWVAILCSGDHLINDQYLTLYYTLSSWAALTILGTCASLTLFTTWTLSMSEQNQVRAIVKSSQNWYTYILVISNPRYINFVSTHTLSRSHNPVGMLLTISYIYE